MDYETEEKMTSKLKDDSTVLACMLRDLEGNCYYVELEDSSEDALIFTIDVDLVKQGLFPSIYLDSRDFPRMGLELIWVLQAPMGEQ